MSGEKIKSLVLPPHPLTYMVSVVWSSPTEGCVQSVGYLLTDILHHVMLLLPVTLSTHFYTYLYIYSTHFAFIHVMNFIHIFYTFIHIISTSKHKGCLKNNVQFWNKQSPMSAQICMPRIVCHAWYMCWYVA